MITTPEQMREAAAQAVIRIGLEIGVTGVPVAMLAAVNAIRAIPIAPQPVAVTVKPLVWKSSRVSDRHERFSANSPWGGYEALEWSDGTFGGTIPRVDCDSDSVEFSVESMSAALAYCQADYVERMKPLFADPLSDPRVVALVDAAKRALNNLENTESEFGITLESADSLRAALSAIGGEA